MTLQALMNALDNGEVRIIQTRHVCIKVGPVVSKTRLSDVDMDENGAWWATILPDGPNLGPAKTRDGAIQLEMRYFGGIDDGTRPG